VEETVSIAAGTWHSLALRRDGTVVAWGRNQFGQTSVPADLGSVVAITAGTHHNLALQADGTVVAWGYNNNGQSTVPPDLSDVIAIAASAGHSLAVTRSGRPVVWGWNCHGECQVPPTATNIVAIAAGYHHDLALRADGSLVVWGDNTYGQASVPPGLGRLRAVAANSHYSLAIDEAWTVFAWGRSGEGDVTNVPPVAKTAIAVRAGDVVGGVLLANGEVVTWGMNSDGQTNVPAGLSSVEALALGAHHCLALLNASSATDQIRLESPVWRYGEFDVVAAPSRGTYIVFESASSLSPPVWKLLSLSAGDSSGIVLRDPNAIDSQTFYRAVVVR